MRTTHPLISTSSYPFIPCLSRCHEPNEVVLEKGGSGGDLLFLNKAISRYGVITVSTAMRIQPALGRMLYKIDEVATLTEHVLVDLPCASSYVAATR